MWNLKDHSWCLVLSHMLWLIAIKLAVKSVNTSVYTMLQATFLFLKWFFFHSFKDLFTALICRNRIIVLLFLSSYIRTRHKAHMAAHQTVMWMSQRTRNKLVCCSAVAKTSSWIHVMKKCVRVSKQRFGQRLSVFTALWELSQVQSVHQLSGNQQLRRHRATWLRSSSF